MKKTIVESNCFTEKLMQCTPNVKSNGIVELGGNYIMPQGKQKLVSAAWNSDGALVCVDANGDKHFFVGTQREFMAWGDETSPHDNNAYQKALKENDALRNQRDDDDDEKEAKKSRIKSKEDSKSSCGFCSVLKCLMKTFLSFLCLSAYVSDWDDENNNK